MGMGPIVLLFSIFNLSSSTLFMLYLVIETIPFTRNPKAGNEVEKLSQPSVQCTTKGGKGNSSNCGGIQNPQPNRNVMQSQNERDGKMPMVQLVVLVEALF
jgi:hypothetical protein